MKYKLTLDCELITPLFMYGADNQTPELRPSEFKGMMRFWWRALKAESNINVLRKQESDIFGGAGDETGEKSKVLIEIKVEPYQLVDSQLKVKEELKWYFDSSLRRLKGNHAGIGYLFYSVLDKSYFKPNRSFKIDIRSLDESAFKNAVAAMWTAIYLGGFGSRSRRCGGCLVVKNPNIESLTNINFTPKGSEPNKLKGWIIENLKKCFQVVGRSNQNSANDYSTISTNLNDKILISKNAFQNWKDAVNEIGKIYMDFRTNHRNQKLELADFGLPIKNVKGIPLNRRASPLILKVIKSENKFFWCAIRLDGILLPKEAKRVFQSQKGEPKINLLDTFWSELKKKAA